VERKEPEELLTKPDHADLIRDVIMANQTHPEPVPSLKGTQQWVKEMVNLLFPLKESRRYTEDQLEVELSLMKQGLENLLVPLQGHLMRPSAEIVGSFFGSLPDVFQMLLEDGAAFLNSDPASENLAEVMLCYPGFFTLTVHRMSHLLYQMEVPVLPRVMSEYAHSKTGIDIHPGARIGRNCFIDHGTGIVIGETAIVGNNVKIYQGVTLGALYVKKNMADTKRHPTIEDNVILYAGCTILGGETVVGHDTIIGGNVWLTESVGAESIVYRENKIRVREKDPGTDALIYII